MRWPWSRSRGDPCAEAADAADEAVRGREDAEAMHAKATAAANRLSATAAANHFREAVEAAMRRKGLSG